MLLPASIQFSSYYNDIIIMNNIMFMRFRYFHI